MTTPATIPIGELTLEEFLKLPRTQQMRIAADFIEALPDNLIAHRFGDFIFTYHSGTANGLRGSWLVVMLPDPDVNGQPHAGTVIRVAEQGWGRERQFTLAELPEELRQENAYRASLGLPPLPDLTTITHSNPAVAPGPEGTSTNSEE